MDISGVLQTIFNVDYVLTPIAADNFVMDSSFVFAKSVMKFFGKPEEYSFERRVPVLDQGKEKKQY